MPSRTFDSNKSSLFATAGTELGGGADDHLPVGGPWSGYLFRSAVRFALDFSGMKRITAAKLRLRTSSQVHVGFSSAPDIYIARNTSDWSANNASADGGGGWSTTPSVYPGPANTNTGRVSKRVSTAESTWVEVDISAIVRAWAPASVAGGGGAANYGISMAKVSDGDVTEFASHEASAGNRPEIVVTYDTDAPPPAPTITTPGAGSVVGGVRPTFQAGCADPDGDPLELADLEVRKAGAIVYSALGFAPGGAASITHTPSADLPPGALTVRMRAQAYGVYGAWSAESPFTVDRAPVVGAFSSPVGATGNRRPPITFATSDADGDPTTAYDLEVYAMVGGVPTGGAVYGVVNQTAGIGAGTVSHTPTVDLPGGTLGVRARVRSGPVGTWSAWSGYQPFTITLTAPTVAWIEPATDGGYAPFRDIAVLATPLPALAFYVAADCRPPAGQTLTNMKEEVKWGTGAWTITYNGPVTARFPVTGGVWSDWFPPDGLPGGVVPYGSGRVRLTVTASGGGTTVVERAWKASVLETRAAVVLGDGVTDLAVALVTKGAAQRTEPPAQLDSVAQWVRAQASADGAAPGATWHLANPAGIAAAQAQLPATNAQLGVTTRYVHREPDADAVVNGSFEDGMTGWTITAGVSAGASSAAQHGANVAIVGEVVAAYPSFDQLCPVVPGASYQLSAYANRFGGATNAIVRADALNAAGALVSAGVAILNFTSPGTQAASYTVPADGSVAALRIIGFINANPTAVADLWIFDVVRLTGPKPGAAGLDRLDLAWRSLG